MHLPLSASLTNGETSSVYPWLWTPMVRNCTCPRMDLYLPTSPSIISRKLKELKLIVLDFASSPPPDTDSPDPNNTSLARSLKELEIQKIIFQYSYKKVRQHYQKRGPKILKQYNEIDWDWRGRPKGYRASYPYSSLFRNHWYYTEGRNTSRSRCYEIWLSRLLLWMVLGRRIGWGGKFVNPLGQSNL